MSIWTAETGPNGVTAEQVLLGWLKQPGNIERYAQATGVDKNTGKGESKTDVVREIPLLLERAGFVDGVSTRSILTKLGHWSKRYQQAHKLHQSGASESAVEEAFPYYYDLVDRVATEPNSPSSPSHQIATQSIEMSREPEMSPEPSALEEEPSFSSETIGKDTMQEQEYPVSHPTMTQQQQEQEYAVSHPTMTPQQQQQQQQEEVPTVSDDDDSSNTPELAPAQYQPTDEQPTYQNDHFQDALHLLELHCQQMNHILDRDERQLHQLVDRILDRNEAQLNRVMDQYQGILNEILRSQRS